MPLEHRDVVKFIDAYKKGAKDVEKLGVCYGASCSYIKAVLSGDEQRFLKRFQLLAQYKDHPDKLFKKIAALQQRQNKKKSPPLTEEEQLLLEMYEFFDEIIYFQAKTNYSDIYNHELLIEQGHGDAEFTLLAKKLHALDVNALQYYLDQLNLFFASVGKSCVLLLQNVVHAVVVTRVGDNQWRLYNISLDTEPRVLTTKELAQTLFQSFESEWGHLLCSIDFIGSVDDPALAKLALSNDSLTNPAQVTQRNSRQSTLLHIAAQHGRQEQVATLLKQGVAADEEDSDGVTPIYLAAQSGYVGIVQQLINHGAVSFKAKKSKTGPINDPADFLRRLNAINANVPDSHHALIIAARNGHADVIQLLIENGADVNYQTENYGTSALYAAAENGHLASINILMANNADLRPTRIGGRTPLYIAIHNGHFVVAQEIINALKQPSEKSTLTQEDLTDIKRALKDAKAAKVLHKATIDLIELAKQGCTDVISALGVAALADLDRIDEQGKTPLHWAAEKGHTATVKALLKAKRNTAWSPLAKAKNEVLRKYVIQQDSNENTAMALTSNEEIKRLLKAAGATEAEANKQEQPINPMTP